MEVAIVVFFCVVVVCATSLKAWAMWINAHPACTRQEFTKLVAQLNTVTQAMAEVQQTADAMRSAVGMTRIGR